MIYFLAVAFLMIIMVANIKARPMGRTTNALGMKPAMM
jgi:hypothetical protein